MFKEVPSMTNHRKTMHFPSAIGMQNIQSIKRKFPNNSFLWEETNSIQRQLPISQYNQNKNQREGHDEGDSHPL